jgi:hypothetical protein
LAVLETVNMLSEQLQPKIAMTLIKNSGALWWSKFVALTSGFIYSAGIVRGYAGTISETVTSCTACKAN